MEKNKTAVIIPSYNESASLKILVNKIFKNLKGAKIIIVDDSPKKENQRIKNLIKKLNNKDIQLISRTKKLGRGSAVMEGLLKALKNKKTRYFFEMDSDLSHKPEEFKLFIDKFKAEPSDLIIGSRYLKDSKLINWSRKRILFSKFINILLGLFLGLNISDYTNGFRLYNRKAVEFLVKTKTKSKGFILLSETAFKLKQKGFKISEVPTTFLERRYGQSSVGPNEFINALVGVLKIKLDL
ncbi:MAG: hypothetical protein ACD_31C00005G0028 [uncultured bacterium]|uniref:Family 2 glycosyl transferase n=3 Tax=Candidatus Daviesiibacteriota TaxID=1752718 RepID=A0A0G0EUL8_9BACT|nr:MAG: hypothetical protein ACD_31C00005G0028 [uncultured bacterium]KKQ10603.1 MAG: family 2 glycosyl transferase [Candidatus Daviesbacteria bacterium GW2011_GWB1_36_5]KKQ15733.1 MAG: family 2 glycosyl transferase [Candidatus Daviesbacteria bacterium GW2011_GWA1_36_8]OGE17849.1 MAG: hypothetical protein A2858_03840 [Candidatus Daviesbacteria bacterium RIFCSPHIGHO2_01_FULL_36_37]